MAGLQAHAFFAAAIFFTAALLCPPRRVADSSSHCSHLPFPCAPLLLNTYQKGCYRNEVWF